MFRVVEADLDAVRNDRMPNPWSLVKDPDEFWGDLSRNGRRLIRELLEGTMEIWRDEYVSADWHRSDEGRRDYRNGYYLRKHWPTSLGPLPAVRVPRCRQKGLTQQMFARLEDHRQELGESVIQMLLAGVSTRRVGELLDRIIQLPVSAGQVSRLAKRLDAQVKAFHRRPIGDQWQYLLLDAIHLKARGTPRLIASALRKSRKRVVLVAYGVTPQGIRQILDFRVASSEKEAEWRRFCQGLYQRGLHGQNLDLITTDGHSGLIEAVDAVWPLISRQRCWFHKMQNVAQRVKKKDRQKVLSGLRAVYAATSRRAALAAWEKWALRWKEQYESAVACVDRDLEHLLSIFRLPPEHRRMMRTTNPIERRFREVRRRTRSIGTFMDDASIERIVFGLISYFNDKYAQRRCPVFASLRVA
jgi:putative transposase